MNYNEIGAKALQEEKTEEAIQAFMQAIESNPEDPSGYINLGNIFAAVNDLERAEQFFQQAIALDEKAATAYYSLANVYYNHDRFEEAAKLYGEAIKLGLHEADAHYMLAKSFEHLGQEKLALPYAQRAAELAKEDVQIQLTYAILLAKVEAFDEARELLEQIIREDEKNADAHYNLGMIYAVSTDDAKRALQHLEQAFTLNPDHIQAREIHTMITEGLKQKGE